MSDSSLLRYLRGLEPEFKFLEGLDGGSHIVDLAQQTRGDFAELTERWGTEYSDKVRTEALRYLGKSKGGGANLKFVNHDALRARAKSRASFIDKCTRASPPVKSGGRWPYPWPMSHFVWQAREGAGKSSIVGELVERGFTVVFCSKTNDQLVEQERGFRERWPDMRVHRHRSKARHLNEQLASIGIDFTPVYHEPRSPYSPAQVDEPSTRQALRKVLDAAGYKSANAHEVFDKLYTQYKSPPVIGLQTDVVLMTLTAFQAYCQARHRPWWHALGLLRGEKRVQRKHRYHEEEYSPPPGTKLLPKLIPSSEPVPKTDEDGLPLIGVELGLDKIIVIIDDPDRTDFDFRRLIEDKDLADIYRREKALPKYQQDWVSVQHWENKGYPPLMAKRLAEDWSKTKYEHEIASFQEMQFEQRPPGLSIGYALQRGFSRKNPLAPKILVTTTEHITAKLAMRTLNTVFKWSHDTARLYEHRMVLRARPDPSCHVTLLSTRLVRKGNHALLLLIAAKLKEEFGDVSLIADGLGCDLNLMNNRGRNDLTEQSTIVKLSVPNPTVALNLWAQFPGSGRPGVLNTILLADLANQAIGRNQGFRYAGRPCIVLVDPMYATMLVKSELLRYVATPWSFHQPAAQALPLHGPMTELEKRLMHWLVPANANGLGASVDGFKIGVALPEKQRAAYEEWLDRNSGTDPGILKRWEARQ